MVRYKKPNSGEKGYPSYRGATGPLVFELTEFVYARVLQGF